MLHFIPIHFAASTATLCFSSSSFWSFSRSTFFFLSSYSFLLSSSFFREAGSKAIQGQESRTGWLIPFRPRSAGCSSASSSEPTPVPSHNA
ncbi:hypothetical protein ACOSQ4_021292 [Xanthoceras sorbifolium]